MWSLLACVPHGYFASAISHIQSESVRVHSGMFVRADHVSWLRQAGDRMGHLIGATAMLQDFKQCMAANVCL